MKTEGGLECDYPRKVAYWSKTEAERAMKRLAAKNGGYGLNVYRCFGHWHVGHDPAKVRRVRWPGK